MEENEVQQSVNPAPEPAPTPEPTQAPEPTPVQNPVPQSTSNGMSIAALVCGILGIVGSFIPVVMYFTTVLAILGIVFGVKGKKIADATGNGKGLAVAGLVLGIIGTAFAVIGLICALACAGALIAASI